MQEPVISCEHLTHYYGKRKIYEDLNFTVEPGRIVGLLGKNGTGMSRKGSVDIVEMASNTLREEKTRL
jgi:ABC-type uncharacterized transport system ATPase subunit